MSAPTASWSASGSSRRLVKVHPAGPAGRPGHRPGRPARPRRRLRDARHRLPGRARPATPASTSAPMPGGCYSDPLPWTKMRQVYDCSGWSAATGPGRVDRPAAGRWTLDAVNVTADRPDPGARHREHPDPAAARDSWPPSRGSPATRPTSGRSAARRHQAAGSR